MPGIPYVCSLREIGAAEEGLLSGVRNIVSGQPPLPRHERVRRLVDLVEVGPLLPVDLDVHEVLVHEPRDGSSSNDSCAITWHQ